MPFFFLFSIFCYRFCGSEQGLVQADRMEMEKSKPRHTGLPFFRFLLLFIFYFIVILFDFKAVELCGCREQSGGCVFKMYGSC